MTASQSEHLNKEGIEKRQDCSMVSVPECFWCRGALAKEVRAESVSIYYETTIVPRQSRARFYTAQTETAAHTMILARVTDFLWQSDNFFKKEWYA
jgi:hypothetical protein